MNQYTHNNLLNDQSNSRNTELFGSSILSENEGIGTSNEHDKSSVAQQKPQDNQRKNKAGLKSFTVSAEPLRTRAKSAPSRPLTEVEAFRKSKEFVQLECAALSMLGLLITQEGKLDLDTPEGSTRGKNFLKRLEELALILNITSADRAYRDNFSRPYKALYAGGPLCYLTEILDSAQERLPFIIVNSEKYVFSTNVLITGDKLFSSFIRLRNVLRDTYYM
jgi:hypothetical protein